MKNLKYLEIREKYLNFYKKHGHKEIPNFPLIPENDPTVLFVNAGMFPLVPFLLGEKHPIGTRLVNSQRCIRTGDIEEVGNTIHCTSFEMLGNWSLNEYFKEEAIGYTVEFFVEELGIDINNIYASVFKGNKDVEKDEVSIEIWKKIFENHEITAKVGKGERIQEFSKKENWWELAAGGPCGPDSEIFYDTGKEACGPNCDISCTCGKYVELGNNVFMEYLKEGKKYSPLGRHNVDFGGGLERLSMISQGKESVHEIDILYPILKKVQDLSKEDIIKSQRIVVDHIKAAVLIIMDGVEPSRNERGYILRRLIRRAVRHGKQLGIEENFTKDVAKVVIKQFETLYPRLQRQKLATPPEDAFAVDRVGAPIILDILSTLEAEEKKFRSTLKQGIKEFEKTIEDGKLTGKEAFHLFETFGFPVEITKEMADEKSISFDMKEFSKAEEAHKEKSRKGSKGFFKGGLADTSEESAKLHTATHLLLAALHQVVGEHIFQKGSNISPERLRLDFPNDKKLSPEELQKVENLVNEQIQKKHEITFEKMSKEKAMKLVPYASFAEKYGDTVKVYSIGDFSIEICGGPHVKNTKELGKFKITKQENVAAGVKRIKAVLE